MAHKTDLNVSPYYDDYTESKNFHKVLFKPSVAIQARELTQLQSILQNQVERFGNHIFEEGSLVLGARTNFDQNVFAVKTTDTNPNEEGVTATESFRVDSLDKFYEGETSGVVAKVVKTEQKTSSDPLTLFVKYLKTGNSGDDYYNEFQDGEDIHRVVQETNGTYTSASDNNEFKVFSQTGLIDVGSVNASFANISEGIIYTRGHFVNVPKQTIILEKYSATPSYKVGLDIAETLVSSTEDTTLLDNAAGTTNENAPGAHRLKIQLTLVKKSLTSTDSTNFIELMRVEGGVVTKKVEITQYSRIQDTLARRTYDESGDYMLQPYTVNFREHNNNGVNQGVYTSTDSPAGDKTKFIAVISSGKAYVRGYEVERNTPSFVTIDKARTTASQNNAASPFRIGNYVKVKFSYGSPDITNFSTVDIYDTAKGSSASDTASGTQIGIARVRAIENDTTGASETASTFNVHLFDVQMFTKLTMQSSFAIVQGAKYIGESSGATGIAITADGSSATLNLINVTGNFSPDEEVKRIEAADGTGEQISANAINHATAPSIVSYNFRRARRLHQSGFAADVVQDANFTLSGTVNVDFSADPDVVNGVATRFASELEIGDNVLFPDGQTGIVDGITSDTLIDLAADLAADVNGKVIRQRAKVYKPDQTVAISGLPHDGIKEVTQVETEIVRRQATQTIGSGKITLPTLATGETYVAFSRDNYVASKDSTGASIDLTGSTFDLSNNTSPNASASFTTGLTGAVTITYTVQRGTTAAATKTLVKSAVARVMTTASSLAYGLGYQHNDITLGVPDVYSVRAIYEGGNEISYGSTPTTTTNPMPPSFVYTADTGNSVAISDSGTLMTGSVSGARGWLIENDSGVCHFYYAKGSATFQNSEALTTEAGAAGTIASLTNGSPNILDRYLMDDGQKDGYYGLAKLVLKPNRPKPSNSLMVVYDFFTHAGSGNSKNYFHTGSYGGLQYEELPNYEADRIDPNSSINSDGAFSLGDSIDYRPSVASLWGTNPTSAVTSATPPDISGLAADAFNYTTSSFTSGHKVDVAQIGSNITLDYTHYLGRIDRLFLTSKGKFEIIKGEASLNPVAGGTIENTIEIASLSIPPYTTHASDVHARLKSHRRYTMRHIEKLQKRLQNLETAVSLSMLEKSTESMQVLDDEGFDKFKSGFVVDSFRGHGIGDVLHPDYAIAIDQDMGIARPTHFTDFFDLEFNSDKSSNWATTGNTEDGYVGTLPYTEVPEISAEKASTELNVNPYDIANFVGRITMNPDKDLWHDRDVLPAITTSAEGNFDAVVAGLPNGVGTVWNEWQQTWAGTPETTHTQEERLDPIETRRRGGGRGGRGGGRFGGGNPMLPFGRDGMNFTGGWARRDADWDIGGRGEGMGGGGDWTETGTAGRTTTTFTRSVTPTTESRTGITTSVVEDIATDKNERLVSVNVIPFMRSIPITITGELLKPNTKLNAFFDGINVNAHCSGTITTDAQGKLSTVFTVPNTSALRFPTGIRTFKVTNGTTIDGKSETSAEGNFLANGSLTSTQEEIISTRNARVVIGNVSNSRSGEIVTHQESTVHTAGTPTIIWEDPLAQSFLVEADTGMFITSVDVYFSTKDEGGIPITCSIREMNNGYPTQRILPSAEATVYPTSITTSSNGQTSTNFKFPHPVYVRPDREYCFVLMSNSNAYHVWCGEMGKFDVHTKEPIDKQPYSGVLFKSQNSSTWTTEQMQDIKFTINRANFTELTGKIVLENTEDTMSQRLGNSPIEIIGTGDTDRFRVYQLSHGMYDNDKSNVTITGVTGDRTNSVLALSTPSVSGTGAVATYTDAQVLRSGSQVNGATANIVLDSTTSVSAISINNPGSGFTQGETLTIAQSQVGGSGATTFCTFTASSVGDTLGGLSIAQINKDHSAIAAHDMDSYEIDVTITGTQGAIDNVRGGGNVAHATKNLYMDVLHTMIPNIQLPGTTILPQVTTTQTDMPQQSDTNASYTKNSASQTVVLNDNTALNTASIVASSINETNEMASARSFQLDMTLTSNSSYISPVIDSNGVGCIGTMNRINQVDSASDVNVETYNASTESTGDNNACTYFTKRIDLENPASELKVIFDGFKPITSQGTAGIETYYKLQKQDDNTPFEEKGWTQFSTTDEPDADSTQYRTYEYGATDLDEFIGFAVKIVMKSKDTGSVPAIKAFRGLALA